MGLFGFGKASEDKLTQWTEDIMKMFRLFRAHKEDLNSGIIVIGTYMFEYEGRLADFSKFMAIRITDSKGVNVDLARMIGFEAKLIENELYVQYPFRNDFTAADKLEVLKRLSTMIQEEYPRDYVELDMRAKQMIIMPEMKIVVTAMKEAGQL